MARPKPDEIQKELDQQADENYGDETYAGHSPNPDSDDDIDEMMKKAVGEDFDEEEPLNLADQIEEDEEDIFEKPINDYQPEEEEEDDEPEGELQRVERKEGLSTDDPMNQVSDDDLGLGDEEEDQE